jgi:ABC-2 type transport system permease protein
MGKFSSVPLSHLLSYPGRIALAYDEPIVVFTISIFAIARGSDAVSGELNRGTLEMLLAQPVSRVQVLATQAFVTLGSLLLLSLATWAGTGATFTAVVKEAPRHRESYPFCRGFRCPSVAGEDSTPMRGRRRAILPGPLNLFAWAARSPE